LTGGATTAGRRGAATKDRGGAIGAVETKVGLCKTAGVGIKVGTIVPGTDREGPTVRTEKIVLDR